MQPGVSPGMNVQTSITPRNVFTDQYTREAGNLAAAQAIPGRDDLFAANMRPGVSVNSPMTQWGVGADLAQSLAQAQMAPQQIGMQHGLANAQNQLMGQLAQGQEALGWGGLGAQNIAAQGQLDLLKSGNLLQLLGGMGGYWR